MMHCGYILNLRYKRKLLYGYIKKNDEIVEEQYITLLYHDISDPHRHSFRKRGREHRTRGKRNPFDIHNNE